MKIVVIGAGVIGASVAFRLAQGGAAVTVIEATRVGGGTSMVTFGWTNANEKLPRQYYDLNVAGMRAYAALRAEFGSTPWWHEGGSIEWPSSGGYEQHARKLERLRGWGYAVHELNPKQLGRESGDRPGSGGSHLRRRIGPFRPAGEQARST